MSKTLRERALEMAEELLAEALQHEPDKDPEVRDAIERLADNDLHFTAEGQHIIAQECVRLMLYGAALVWAQLENARYDTVNLAFDN